MKKDPYASEDFTKKYLELSQLPEPLRLAAGLEETMQWPLHGKAADCLRRLHEENERLKAQPAAQWAGLTDEDEIPWDGVDAKSFAHAIEAKLREKNGLYRQHVTDGSPCWCEPETSYTDPETGASVIVHREPQ